MLKAGKVCAIVFALCLALTVAVSAKSDETHIFFAPQSMNEADEIIVPVYIENLPEDNDKLCGTEFRFVYNTEYFSLKTDENGNPLFEASSVMLVQNVSKIEASENSGIVSVSYVDFGEAGGGVLRDGPMFFFTLIPKNPNALWNSDDYYPLRFLPGSVNLITRDGQNLSFTGTAAEGLDTYVGGYNVFPSFETPKIPDTVEFVSGVSAVRINWEETANDAAPYEKDGDIMIPVRYFAEAVGAEVYWDDENQAVSLYFPYHSAYLDIDDSEIYINSKIRNDLPKAEEINGRTYASLSVIESVFGDVMEIQRDGVTITIENK